MTKDIENLPQQTSTQAIQHALRNKLGIVIGSIDILLITEPLSDDGKGDLERARRACVGMLDLIETMTEEDGT